MDINQIVSQARPPQAGGAGRKWEGNYADTIIKKFIDLDIKKAHKSTMTKMHEKKGQVDDFNKTIRRKSMIRYLTIVVDLSIASLK